MLQAVIFDFGGVILQTQSRQPRHAWDKHLGVPLGTVEETFFNSPQGRAAQHGQHSETEQWQWVGAHFGLSQAQLSQLEEDFWAGDALDQALIAQIRQLKQRVKVGLISNAMDGLRAYLAQKELLSLFDNVVISAEFGIMKPDPAIYQHALQALDVAPETAVFIDDFQHNIDGAAAVGMHGILFTPETDLSAALSALRV